MARAYTVSMNRDVRAFVATADPQTLWYWNVSLALIAEDPEPRFGSYSERILIGLPSITHNFWITDISFASGERVMAFTAEYWDYRPVYVLDETRSEIAFFSIRDRWVYDPIDPA